MALQRVIRLSASCFVIALLGFVLTGSHAQVGRGNYVVTPRWSPDGSRIATTVGYDIEIRDTLTGHISVIDTGHTDFVPMVAWSPDSRKIAIPSYDMTITVWDAGSGELLHTLTGHNEWVTAAVWSPDGTRLLSWGFENRPNLFVWDVVTGDLLNRVDSGTIDQAEFSPNGDQLTLTTSLSLLFLDARSLQLLVRSPRVRCCGNVMQSLKWSPDGGTLATGSINGLVTLWDADTAQIVWQVPVNPYHAPDSRDVKNVALSWVRDVAFTPDGRHVLAISGDGSLVTLEAATGARQDEAQIGSLYTAAWSPYSGRLAVLAPTAQERPLSPDEAFDARSVTGQFDILVPAPSLERLNGIAAACLPETAARDPFVADSLAEVGAFVERLGALPDDAIPPACRADLLAVAEALLAEGAGE